MQRIAVEIIWLFCRVVAITPYWFRYSVLSPVICFVAYRCCRYRVKVVNMNLRNSFPEADEREITKIRDEYYTFLAEIVVSTISLAGNRAEKSILSDSGEGSRIAELKAKTASTSWVALTAHFGLWEYFMFWVHYTDQDLVAVYHPLRNRVFETVFRRFRTIDNVVVMPIKDTIRYCLESEKRVDSRHFVIGLIADQNPPRRPDSQWFNFLNQDSIFFDGGAKIALRLSIPVYFVYQRRTGRGVYTLDYEVIYDGTEEMTAAQITARYVESLERVIRETPYLWLWSHRRWKHIH